MKPRELIMQSRKLWPGFLPRIIVYRRNSQILQELLVKTEDIHEEIPMDKWDDHFDDVAFFSSIRWYNTDASNRLIGTISGNNTDRRFLGTIDADGMLTVPHHNRFKIVDIDGQHGMQTVEKLPGYDDRETAQQIDSGRDAASRRP